MPTGDDGTPEASFPSRAPTRLGTLRSTWCAPKQIPPEGTLVEVRNGATAGRATPRSHYSPVAWWSPGESDDEAIAPLEWTEAERARFRDAIARE